MGEEVLAGGVANAGAVVRDGAHVLRPAPPNVDAIHALLRYVRGRGFDGVNEPVGVDRDGRERLVFVEGDVPLPPYPPWFLTDLALGSAAALLRRFHHAAAGFVPPPGTAWSDELGDPVGGPVVCHNDLCPENLVYRDGVAVALLDFDFAAPGRPLFDLAALARMCVPIDPPDIRARTGREHVDPFSRLRVVADAYGVEGDGRAGLVDVLGEQIASGGEFTRRRVERGEAAFVEMWRRGGGQARYDRRREWFEANRSRFVDAVVTVSRP